MNSKVINSKIWMKRTRAVLVLMVVVLSISFILPTLTSAQDTTPPTTALTTNPVSSDGSNEWFITIPSITLTRDEPGTTYYSWDSNTGPWTTYSASFNASEGEDTLYYYSVDTEGNSETVKSQLFKVDTGAPTNPIVLSPSHIVGGWSKITQ